MMHFTCPHCTGKIRGKDDFAGRIVPCPACGGRFRVPEAVLSLPAVPRRRSLWPMVLISVLPVLVGGSLGAWLLLRTLSNAPLMGYPDTCRGVAERLQKNGMQMRWRERSDKHPAIFVVKPDTGADSYFENLNHPDIKSSVDGWAAVVQYPDERSAREEAGRRRNAFAWGRFVIWGDVNVVKEIRRRL